MSSQSRARVKPDALREQLDELDQLMERMLALELPPRESKTHDA